jgi:hypothetical protein
MDEPSAQAQVQLSTNYSRVIKDIKNLEQFYDAKVLAIRSTTVSEKPTVSFGQAPTLPKPKPIGPYGDSSQSDGSWFPGRDYRPDTPEPETEQQKKARLRETYVQPKR